MRDDGIAIANDNRVPAGTESRGVRRVTLVARRAQWRPDAESPRALDVETFAEEGRPASVPAPLLRVGAGTALRLTVRNALPDTFVFCGLARRSCIGTDSLWIAPGDSAVLEARGDAPGTYIYWGVSMRGGEIRARGDGGQLIGAYVVDSLGGGPTLDRVFVMTSWMGKAPVAAGSDTPFVMAVNGLTWPSTERLSHAVGDTVRWRVISGSGADHPMHLHGFYFRVDARGDRERDTVYAPGDRRMVVTENLPRVTSMSITWVPERAGNWLFHCHRAFHMTSSQHRHLQGQPNETWGPTPERGSHEQHAMRGMAGLVMGITVSPRAIASASDSASTMAPRERRPLRLLVQRRAGTYGASPGLGYVLQRGDEIPRGDSVQIPGPPIVLTRGEPVEITVVNRLDRTTAVHWHGIELESYFDGVGGWSGTAGSLAPPIAPGDSFIVRFTPPRSGTFMYHSHVSEINQLSSGLYGALIVVDDATRWDPRTDHVMILGQRGPSDSGLVVLNGGSPPPPMTLQAGVRHRFRFINIVPQDLAEVLMGSDSTTLSRWTPVAKDGADLPQAQRVERPARVATAPGETFDFEMVPRRGVTQLFVRSFNNFALSIRAQ